MAPIRAFEYISNMNQGDINAVLSDPAKFAELEQSIGADQAVLARQIMEGKLGETLGWQVKPGDSLSSIW